MTNEISVTSKRTTVFGFTINDRFYPWEVLESLSDSGGSWFFDGGSQEAQPLIEAGLAEFHAFGDGTIVGTDEAQKVYEQLKEEFWALVEKERTRR